MIFSTKKERSQFVFAAIGLIAGAVLTFLSSYGLWFFQEEHEYKNGVKLKREELISESADLFARAPRIKGIYAGHLVQLSAASAHARLCESLLLQGKQPESCKNGVDYSGMANFNQEIFEYTARFNKLRSLIDLYFCHLTKTKFDEIVELDHWWDISQQQIRETLKVMHVEYRCNL